MALGPGCRDGSDYPDRRWTRINLDMRTAAVKSNALPRSEATRCALSHFTSSTRPTSVDIMSAIGGTVVKVGHHPIVRVFDFVKHAPDHDTVLKRYETSLDAMATTRRPYTSVGSKN
jgi:hypothetical protein